MGKMSSIDTTPNFVNQLAIQIADSKEGSFYDGTFGLGGSVIEFHEYAMGKDEQLHIYGQEIDE